MNPDHMLTTRLAGGGAAHRAGLRPAATARLLAFGLCVAGLLAACGGGTDYVPSTTSSSTTATSTDANPLVTNTESLAVMRQGDTWMYEWINKTEGSGFYSTHYLATLDKSSQLYTHQVFFSDDQPFQTLRFSSSNALTASSVENTLCNNEPQSRSVFPRRPWAVGATWTYLWRETCLNGTLLTTVDKAVSGRVVSVSEKITMGLLGQGGTAGGSVATREFDTVKYTLTRTERDVAGSWSYAQTCWHDKAQDRTVKCDIRAEYTPAGASAPTRTYDQEQRLAFVREVRSASPVAITDGVSSVAVYAGRWNFKLQNVGGVVTCPTMKISLTGQLAGNCVRLLTLTSGSTQEVPFPVSGFIVRRSVTTQASGQAPVTRTIDSLTVVADAGAYVLSLSGEMVSPLLAEGTWTGDGVTSGTWVAQRL